jgi:CheY-like chemotaxis protein
VSIPKIPVPSVLIVEDEPLIRAAAAMFLDEEGLKIYEAHSADEAIRVLELHAEIRLIFTDINMPGSMDGLKLAHYVRDRWPPVKIIVTSGKMSGYGMPMGAVFLGKPYHPDHLTRRVRDLLAEAA